VLKGGSVDSIATKKRSFNEITGFAEEEEKVSSSATSSKRKLNPEVDQHEYEISSILSKHIKSMKREGAIEDESIRLIISKIIGDSEVSQKF